MPRPRMCRHVEGAPKVGYFKPGGVPLRELEEVTLPVEGLEALRLADLENMTTAQAAEGMGVSRHTFGRILGQARNAVAQALVQGKALRIEGGAYALKAPAHPSPVWVLDPGRVAVSVHGPGEGPGDVPALDLPLAPRFGRAGGFVLVDVATMEAAYLDNAGSQAMAHGAGAKSVERIAEQGAGVLLTGRVGEKAFTALREAGVQVCLELDGLTVRQAVERFRSGGLAFAEGPNA
uniref:UPF0251 protein ENR59_01555 n=1 Tax=Fundidesulfovibrio putealis TaxID=270496 RepID=A0A7C3WCE8_9BACT